MKINQGGNNIIAGCHYHPHVGSSGGICWGNANESYKDYCLTANLEGIVDIVTLILTNYNDESPYVSLDDFNTVYQRTKQFNEKIKSGTFNNNGIEIIVEDEETGEIRTY